MQETEVVILNWEKFNPRKDVSNPSWFRLQNQMWNDSQFFTFTAEERWIWVCLLSIASQKNTSKLSFCLEWLALQTGVSNATIENALIKLERNGCVTSTLRARDVHGRYITDITNKTNITKQDKTKTFSSELKNSITEATEQTLIKSNFTEFLNNKIETLYPDKDFVTREKEKMKVWLAANPKKSPKSKSGWTRFVMGWLERGWEQYRKSIQTEKPKKKTWMDLVDEEEKQKEQGRGENTV